MRKDCGELEMSNKVFYSDPHKDKLISMHTYNLLITLRKLGLDFDAPIREILQPLCLDGIMLDKFIQAFVRLDDK